MKRVLFAWIGKNDLKAAAGVEDVGIGPIAQVATTNQYSRIILLDDYYRKENTAGYVEWLKGFTEVDIVRREVDLKSPIDFAAIYLIAEHEVRSEISTSTEKITPVFHLSPGTPAMASVWVLLGKARFQDSELVRSSREVGVEMVDIPFEISAEFSPAIAKAADERLARLTEALPPRAPEFEHIIHKCDRMKKLVAQARVVALHDVNVLIEGETGTGKELFARAIHKASQRKDKKFIPVNCGAVPKDLFEAEFFGHNAGAFTGAVKERVGHFEAAHGGTLFLDEIGEMPVAVQVKILRVLQEKQVKRIGENEGREVDVRIIAATNRKLLDEVVAGRFRSDLFYRLAVAILGLPPLSERTGDIGLLIDFFLDKANREFSVGNAYTKKRFSPKAKNQMLQHSWMGNARELENTIKRICIWCPDRIIHEEDVLNYLLPSHAIAQTDAHHKHLGKGFKLQAVLDDVSRQYINRAIRESGGNKKKATELLGLTTYQTLSNWMKKLGIEY